MGLATIDDAVLKDSEGNALLFHLALARSSVKHTVHHSTSVAKSFLVVYRLFDVFMDLLDILDLL